ncbi:HK97 gp10 family phage protein [Formosa haliotis]|uniref:HK97 gp10 family phage protein n=1 Tax=Formosa haliotis TaxID=1555194 RepID=UPI0008247161|nr:HK97 gp10 family phage protein [Formosa haliotis]
MAGLKPQFNRNQVQGIVDQFQTDIAKKLIRVLQYAGEQFVNDARKKGNYRDRTGNLRSSIGYMITHDGQTIESNFEGLEVGQNKAKELANRLAFEHPKGIALFGVAGMEYSAYVEAKGYDVISGSVVDQDFIVFVLNGL